MPRMLSSEALESMSPAPIILTTWCCRQPEIAMMPLLAFVPALIGQVPVIDDTAHIFIAREMAEIAGKIESIESDFHVRVVVDTVKSLPWAAQLWVSVRGPDAAEHYLDNWAHRRGRKAGTRGIYILVCREPLAVRVQAGSGLRGIM